MMAIVAMFCAGPISLGSHVDVHGSFGMWGEELGILRTAKSTNGGADFDRGATLRGSGGCGEASHVM
jgi:hypothetical protein